MKKFVRGACFSRIFAFVGLVFLCQVARSIISTMFLYIYLNEVKTKLPISPWAQKLLILLNSFAVFPHMR